MELEYVIDEQATIKEADIEKVYDECVSWLKKIRARIKEQDRPYFLHASHFERFDGQTKRTLKRIHIRLSQRHESVMVSLIIDAPEGITLTKSQRMFERYRLSWGDYVEGLWKSIGVEMNSHVKRQIYQYDDLRNQATFFSRNMLIMIGITVIIFIYMMYLGISDITAFRILGGLIFLNSYIIFKLYLKISMLKSRLRELYPDR